MGALQLSTLYSYLNGTDLVETHGSEYESDD